MDDGWGNGRASLLKHALIVLTRLLLLSILSRKRCQPSVQEISPHM